MTNAPQRTEHSTFLRGAEELFLGPDGTPVQSLDGARTESDATTPGAPRGRVGESRAGDRVLAHEPSGSCTAATETREVTLGHPREKQPAEGAIASNEQLRDDEAALDAGALKALVHSTFALVGPGLVEVEQTVRSAFVTESPQLYEIASHLLATGGKRIRPILALLSNMLLRPSSSAPLDQDRWGSLVKAAAGIELIHMATLLHDDIIDQSTQRRHRETAYVTYGLTPTLLAGDFLWVRAFGLCAHLGEYVVRSTERACVELTEGELMEGTLSPERSFYFDDYLQIVSKKTASLFALSSALGAHFAGATVEERDRLEAFGREAGIAFQMVDDILDVVSTDDLLGKPAGTDLRQRTPSLVNVLWLVHDPERAQRFFGQPEITPAMVDDARMQIAQSPVIAQARSIARERTDRARAQLTAISASRKDTQIERHLFSLLEYTLRRCL